MYTSSVFNIKIDFEKSHDSYIYDKKRDREFLDFFGGYSTLPLGYNHPIFQGEFKGAIARISGIKIPNCEIVTDEGLSFLRNFTNHSPMFQHFYFCSTGALAVEAAIKTALTHKQGTIVSLKNSFHGINGYGGFVSDRFPPISHHLEGFPEAGWHSTIGEGYLPPSDASALLIEPIQSTYGDHYLDRYFLHLVRAFCTKYNICLIFDEIQTGFGTTGKMWYFQHLDIEPDIVCFGKKSQISGIMVKEKFGKIFESPLKLDVTWDGDLIDMVRCDYILKAYEKYSILENVKEQGREFLDGLKRMRVKNPRGIGLIVAFDLETNQAQSDFARRTFESGLLFNKTREKTIRFRPNLNVSSDEVQRALEIIQDSL